jgi:DNA-binding transcriptional LysR family regulator
VVGVPAEDPVVCLGGVDLPADPLGGDEPRVRHADVQARFRLEHPWQHAQPGVPGGARNAATASVRAWIRRPSADGSTGLVTASSPGTGTSLSVGEQLLSAPRAVRRAPGHRPSPAIFDRFRDHGWIVNSRNTADEHVVRTIASMASYEPRITHRADSLDLVQDLIVAGFGIALLPADQPTLPGVRLLPLVNPDVTLRAYAVIRRGRARWPPLALVLDLLTSRRSRGDDHLFATRDQNVIVC